MCEPVTISMGVAMAATAVAGGISAYSQYQSAKFEEEQANANAQTAATSANRAEAVGAAEAGRLRTEGTQVISQQKVALASGGVDTSSGSAMNLFATTRATNELDVQTTRHRAAMEAWGHRVEEGQYRAQAKIARRNSVLGPLATSIGTIGQMAGTYQSTHPRGR